MKDRIQPQNKLASMSGRNYKCSVSQKYNNISVEIRQKFINRVIRREATVRQAAQEFGIKFSTSKAILQTYKKYGRIGKKQTRDRSSQTAFFTNVSSPIRKNQYSAIESHRHNGKNKGTGSSENFPFFQQQTCELKQNRNKTILEVELEKNINSLFNIDFKDLISKAEQQFAYLLMNSTNQNTFIGSFYSQLPLQQVDILSTYSSHNNALDTLNRENNNNNNNIVDKKD